MAYTKEELPPTPQAHSTKVEALKLGAELIERELLNLRHRSMRTTPPASAEYLVMDAMDKGIRAGRLRAMVEVEEEREERKRLEGRR